MKAVFRLLIMIVDKIIILVIYPLSNAIVMETSKIYR